MASITLDNEVSIYIYKCLLRRRQALQLLRPIDFSTSSFDDAIKTLAQSMAPNDVCSVDKQMCIYQAKKLDIYVDASAQDHDNLEVPTRASVSFIIKEEDATLYERAEYLGSSMAMRLEDKSIVVDITVNVAEYMAVIRALEFIVENEFKEEVTIHSDSLLVVNQVNFASATRAPKLLVLRDYARRLMSRLKDPKLVHLDREQNKSADALARQACKDYEEAQLTLEK